MNIQEAIKVSTVIHCETESEAKRILNMAHELGYKWNNGRTYTDDNYWGTVKNKTCYNIELGAYGDCGYFEEGGYKIINSTDITDMEKSSDWTPAPERFEIDKENSTRHKIMFRKVGPKFPTKLSEIDRPWYIDIIGDIAYSSEELGQSSNHFTSKESAKQALTFTQLLAFRDAIWEIEGEPENTDIDISFNFKTPEGLEHFEKMRREIIADNL